MKTDESTRPTWTGESDDPFYDTFKVASATECTGLMPSLPENQDEDENYAELYSTHSAPRKRRNRTRN